MNHFRTKSNIVSHGARDMADLLYFELLRLTVLYRVYETSDVANEYARRTLQRPISAPFSMNDTDLKATLLYFYDLKHRDNVSKKDQILLNRIDVDISSIFNYIRKIQQGQDISTIMPNFLRKMQRSLSIDSPRLRAMKTLVEKWDTLKTKEMKVLLDKMDNYGTLYIRRGELTSEFRKLKKVERFMRKDKDDSKFGIGAGDALLGLASGMALKWALQSRAKNKQSFSRLSNEPKSFNPNEK